MRKILGFILLFSFTEGLAQIKKPENSPLYDYDAIHFGFSVGLNTMDFGIKPAYSVKFPDSVKSVDVKRYPGFNLNIISNLRVNDYLDIRFLPGLVFGQRDLIYTIEDTTQSNTENRTVSIESIFVEAPLVIKYKAHRLNNHRHYVVGGINYRFDMDGKEIDPDQKRKDRLRKLNRSDIYYEIGYGIDFYLPYFKLSSELKFSVGLLNILRPDQSKLTSSIKKLNSRMVILSFHFE